MKTWTRNEIDALLKRSPRAVGRAMIVLHARQTADEQRADTTKHKNNRGFCSWAAKRGSYYARWVQSGRVLTGWHLQKATRIALYHSKQLVEEANKGRQD